MREVSEARTALAQQAKGDFRVIAGLLGKVVGRQIVKSRHLIEGLSVHHTGAEREVARLIEVRDAVGLKAWGQKVAPEIALAGFKLFMIADAHGKLLLRIETFADNSPVRWNIMAFDDPSWRDKDFSFREWFTGENEQPEPEESRPYKPLQGFHISRPYWSVAWQDNTWKKTDFGPAISAPITHEGQIVGVIAGQVPSDKLDHWSRELALPGGFAAILSDGCVLQSHPGFTNKAYDLTGHGAEIMLDPTKNGHAPGEYQRECRYCRLWKYGGDDKRARSYVYLDPLKGERYTVDYAQIDVQSGEEALRNWHVVVQKETGKLFKEFDDIERTGGRWWLGALAAVLGCFAMFWVLSDWLLKERGRLDQIMRRLGAVVGIMSPAQDDQAPGGPLSGTYPQAS